jgi:hypothetical protein
LSTSPTPALPSLIPTLSEQLANQEAEDAARDLAAHNGREIRYFSDIY